jgi:hypothetical protein
MEKNLPEFLQQLFNKDTLQDLSSQNWNSIYARQKIILNFPYKPFCKCQLQSMEEIPRTVQAQRTLTKPSAA